MPSRSSRSLRRRRGKCVIACEPGADSRARFRSEARRQAGPIRSLSTRTAASSKVSLWIARYGWHPRCLSLHPERSSRRPHRAPSAALPPTPQRARLARHNLTMSSRRAGTSPLVPRGPAAEHPSPRARPPRTPPTRTPSLTPSSTSPPPSSRATGPPRPRACPTAIRPSTSR